MLTTFTGVSQVLYTTHSPGCLPPDLGTGVRLVIPDELKPNESIVAPSFWSQKASAKGFGFLPLLYMLGARSAAFSRLRSALLVEGHTEAILLPSLIREATKVDDLSYQVVPGLSEADDEGLADLNAVAVNVAYLVDGDQGGDGLLVWLETLKTPKSHTNQLPKGFAVEDLLDPVIYATAINSLAPSPTPFTITQGGEKTYKAQATEWAKLKKVKLPGPVVVAETILASHESGTTKLALQVGANDILRALDLRVREALAASADTSTRT
jgi:hypothetical protein